MDHLMVRTFLLQYGLSLKPNEPILNISIIIDEAIEELYAQEITWNGIARLHTAVREALE